MLVEPAHLDQIRRGRDGRMHVVDADVGGVAEELRRIHPGLGVRYHEAGEYFSVFFEEGRETYLILTAQHLDHRIVERIREVDNQGRSGYDYARELESSSRAVKEAALQRFRDRIAEFGAEAQFALRKDLGSKNRAFVPADISA